MNQISHGSTPRGRRAASVRLGPGRLAFPSTIHSSQQHIARFKRAHKEESP
jgi:hypothetical protein